MTAVWPASLPDPLRASYSHSYVDSRLAKPTEGGPPGYRRRFSQTVKVVNVSFAVNRDQLATIETFYETTVRGGTLPFLMIDPLDINQPVIDGDGNPVLDGAGNPVLIDTQSMYSFGDSTPQTVQHGIGYLVSFNLTRMP